MIFKLILIGIILFVAFCILSLLIYNKDVEKKMKNREKFESIHFSSKTVFNENIDSSVFSQKKITLVNIWGTYCSSCINELPDLQEIYDELKKENIGVLGIISDLKLDNYKDRDLKKAIGILKENNITYPNIFADNTFVEYAKGKLFLIPTTVFVDNQGNVIGEIIESAYSKQEFIDVINKLLNNESNFKIDIRNLSCSIDGKCELKK